MIEFAIVLILLNALLHEFVTDGLNLSARATMTAAADAARTGLVGSPRAVPIAEAQTATERR